jgi:hypothetical protein
MRRDLSCAALLLAVAAGYDALARGIGQTALADAIGPAGLPRIYAAVLAVLAVALGAVACLGRLRAEPHPPENDGVTLARRLSRAAGAIAIGVAYLAIVPMIGYPFAMALTIAAMIVYQGERPTLRVALVASAGAAALFLLFDWALGVTMPAPWNA